MYVIYPADDLISLLITREYTQRRTGSGISPVVPQTPTTSNREDGTNVNRPFRNRPFYNSFNNNNLGESSSLLDNQEFQFEPSHFQQSEIFSEQLRDQHNRLHFSDSRENSLERYFVNSDLQREPSGTNSGAVEEPGPSNSSSAGARAVSAALFPSSNNQNQLRARSTTPAPGDRSPSVSLEVRSRPTSFIREGSTETTESGSNKNKPKRSVSFHTFDRKNSATRKHLQPGLVNGQPPSVAAVTTSRLNLNNRRVSPAPDLVETRQGFGSNTTINTSATSNNPSGSKSNSLIKKGKSWLPRITFSIQEEREEHPKPAGASSAPTPTSSTPSSSSHQHSSHHHRQPHHQDHHNQSSFPSSSALPSPAGPPELDSFAEFLGKSYRGAANQSAANKLDNLIQSGPSSSSKGQRGTSPATGSSTTPTSGHQRFAFLNHSGKGGGSSAGGGSSSSTVPSGGAIAAGLGLGGTMAGVNGGVSSIGIGSMISLGIGHHGAGHLIAGQLVDANSLKDCVHPSLNESLKSHNSLSFKVIRIVSDFTQQLSQLHEQHAVQLQMLIENYRKRNAELRKERPPCNSAMFQIWETLLQEVELDSQAHSDVSASLARQVARPLLEKTFCLKIQSRKVFAHRESFETVLSKTEALLAKAYRDYSDACMQHIQMVSNQSLAQYYEAHNAYIQQLRGTNSMLKEYHTETLPALLQELEDVYVDLCKELSDSVMVGSEIIAIGSPDSTRRYDQLAAVCRNINGIQDLKEFVKTMVVPAQATPRHTYTLPLPLLSAQEGDYQDLSHVPVLKDELVMDRLITNSIRNRVEGLRKEMAELEAECKPIQDSLDTLVRMQQRSLDSNLYNKANELQEEISMKRFDLRVAQMQLAALRAQRELFGPIAKSETSSSSGKTGKLDRIGGLDTVSIAGEDLSTGSGGSGGKGSDRKLSAATAVTMKSKWLKAFKSLKTTGPAEVKEADKKNTKDKDNKEPFQIFENHIFQEYTYKKITPCDICSQILRGHTRQGLRCRMCKMNVHPDCQEKVDKCQPKTRLLRRQRSTSELETRLSQMTDPQQEGEDTGDGNGGGGNGGASASSTTATTTTTVAKTTTSKGNGQGKLTDEMDQTYQVLKEANVLKKPGGSGGSGGSGNGFHGSLQTLHSQHEMTPNRLVGRSNPSVNIIPGPGPGSSGHNTPAGPGHPMSVAAAPASGARGPIGSQRRDSYVARKCMSADAGGPSNPAALSSNPRSISLTDPMPHSPRRRKLDLRMKSFSLDSPESTEHAQRRRYAHGSHSTSHSQSAWSNKGGLPYANGKDGFMMMMPGSAIGNGMIHSNSSAFSAHASPSSDFYCQNQSPFASINHFAPSSPVHNRRTLLSTRNMRMSSVELPDENDKSHSSASTSPCPSPQKPHRLLPTNLYVVLYNFKARHPDELDLKAGYKITVIDTTDPDWWQGKCLGRVGYFPSKYVTKLHPGEKPLQVTHNLQVTDGADNGLKLLRDQIVIQIGEELDGMVTIRNGENKTGVCPRKYLQEV